MDDHDHDQHEVLHGEIFDASAPIQNGGGFNQGGVKGVVGTDGPGLLALALAISSWMILPIIGAIAALIIAPGAVHRIRQADGALGTVGIVRAAQVIAILNLVVCLGVIFVVFEIIKAL